MSNEADSLPREEAFVICLYNHELENHCNFCLVQNASLKRCGACRKMFYCSSSCQKKDWQQHKPECKTIKERSDEGDVYHRMVMRLIALYRANKLGEIEFMNETRSLKTMCSSKKIETEESDKFYQFYKDFAVDCDSEELVKKIHLNALCNSFAIWNPIGCRIGRGFCIKLSKIPHSCKPSTRTVFNFRTAFLISNYKKEVDLTNDTRTLIDELQPLWRRREVLKNTYDIDCQCEGCLDEIRNAKMESWHCINCEKGWLKNNETAKCEECGWQITKDHYDLCMVAESAAKEALKTMDRLDIPRSKKVKIGEKLMLLFSGTLHKQNVYRLPILRELHHFNTFNENLEMASDYAKQILDIRRVYCSENDITLTFFKFALSNCLVLLEKKEAVKELLPSTTQRLIEIYGKEATIVKICLNNLSAALKK